MSSVPLLLEEAALMLRALATTRIGCAALGAALLFSAPAGAQALIYEGQYGGVPRYAPPAYAVLAPGEVRNIIRNMGYGRVSVPRLVGPVYLVAAVDDEGPVTLRVDARTGRVVSAYTARNTPTIVAPAPYRPAPPAPRTARVTPPAAAPSAGAPPAMPAFTPAPLPPSRPPEASMAAVTPAPVAPPVPPVAAPGAPAPQSEATAPAAPQAATAPAPAAQQPAAPPRKKAGAGTATTDSAAAGSASVLSRPKPQ